MLRKLAMLNVAKGEPEAASSFAHALAGDPVWGGWSRRLLARLEADPLLADDPEVARLRKARGVRDAPDYLGHEQALHDLLDADPGNRMAFEYLMAHYLLTKQLEKFVGELDRLGSLDYGRMPTHYQEALQLYRMLTLQAAEVPGYKVSKATADRLQQFFAVLKSYGRDRERARVALVPDFRGSYPFYYVFAAAGG
jgi:hypothetical protein